MKRCASCGLSGDADSFYTTGKWCRLCVEAFVKSKKMTRKNRQILQRPEREQKAIREVVKQLQGNRSFVYLIQGPSGYKIGFSKHVARRASQLNTAFGSSCIIVAVAPGGRELEKSLHYKHRLKRLNREWFAQSEAILQDFSQLVGSFVFLKGYMTP